MSVKVTWETKWDALREDHREEIMHWRKEIFITQATDDYHDRFEWESRSAGGVVVYCDDHVASFLKIVDRTIRLDELDVPVGGVSGVMTIPEYRKRGFAGLALSEAQRVTFEILNARASFLLCGNRHLTFYPRYGWQPLRCPVEFDQPEGKKTWPEKSMILGKAEDLWDPKKVDLHGLPW